MILDEVDVVADDEGTTVCAISGRAGVGGEKGEEAKEEEKEEKEEEQKEEEEEEEKEKEAPTGSSTVTGATPPSDGDMKSWVGG